MTCELSSQHRQPALTTSSSLRLSIHSDFVIVVSGIMLSFFNRLFADLSDLVRDEQQASPMPLPTRPQQSAHEMNEETAALARELLCEGFDTVASRYKGKQPEGVLTDEQYALRLLHEEASQLEQDRRMAESMMAAVRLDASMLASLAPQTTRPQTDSEIDDEALARLESRYWTTGLHHPPPSDHSHGDLQASNSSSSAAFATSPAFRRSLEESICQTESDIEDEQHAESSAWAASRVIPLGQDIRRCSEHDMSTVNHDMSTVECIACETAKTRCDIVTTPCGHFYCASCITDLFEHSMIDESLYPPRFCKESIDLELVRRHLKPGLASTFEQKSVELNTKNRIYCSEPACNTFILPRNIENDIASCRECPRTTCVNCRHESHSGDCPEDADLQRLQAVAAVVEPVEREF